MAEVSKCLVNEVSRSVDDCLEGLVASNPGLELLEGHRVVVRSDVDKVKAEGKVTLVSGGGAGHEPAHAGYVGCGMLSAAVSGAVFTSPPPASILAAIRTVCGSGGTLLVIKNYTGDRLNFGLAAERAKSEGLQVEMVVVGEDCALTSTDKTAGRRGLCGTVLIHKIAGALAAQGKHLDEIAKICRDAVTQMGTIGVSLSPCSLPGAAPSFSLDAQQMELGLGIHGEVGVKRIKLLSAKDSVAAMFDHMSNPESSTKLSLQQGDRVALVVNNLGGTSVLELNIMTREAINWLGRAGVCVERVYSGSFMTSLQMAGVSLTVLHLDSTLTSCLDYPTLAPGWCSAAVSGSIQLRRRPVTKVTPGRVQLSSDLHTAECSVILDAVNAMCEKLLTCENELNDLDRLCGDGDCGSTLVRGAQGMMKYVEENRGKSLSAQTVLNDLAEIVEQDMGGSSGAVYSIFLAAAAAQLNTADSATSWYKAMDAGIQAISRYGGAEEGDRTMLDALCPAVRALGQGLEEGDIYGALQKMAQAAQSGAAATANMAARAGRASYVSADHLTRPDPGAQSVAIWITALQQHLAKDKK